MIREGAKPSGELQESLSHAVDSIKQARGQMLLATEYMKAVQQRCPHNNIRQDINTAQYHCIDCEAELNKVGDDFVWAGLGVRYEIDTFFWNR